MLSTVSRLTRRLALAALATAAFGAQANEGRWTYEVTVTNITYNQQFTPLLLATHKPTITFFTLGQPGIAPLVTLAEEGNIAPLARARRQPLVTPRLPQRPARSGQVVSFQIQGNPWRDRLEPGGDADSHDDAFVSLNAVQLPTRAGRRNGISPCLRRRQRSQRRAVHVDSRPVLRRVWRLGRRRQGQRRRRLRACAPRRAWRRRLEAQRTRLAQPCGRGARAPVAERMLAGRGAVPAFDGLSPLLPL